MRISNFQRTRVVLYLVKWKIRADFNVRHRTEGKKTRRKATWLKSGQCRSRCRQSTALRMRYENKRFVIFLKTPQKRPGVYCECARGWNSIANWLLGGSFVRRADADVARNAFISCAPSEFVALHFVTLSGGANLLRVSHIVYFKCFEHLETIEQRLHYVECVNFL